MFAFSDFYVVESVGRHPCRDDGSVLFFFFRRLLLLLLLLFFYRRLNYVAWCSGCVSLPNLENRPLYLYPPEAGWPGYTPRHRVPILVAFYDTHGLLTLAHLGLYTPSKVVPCAISNDR